MPKRIRAKDADKAIRLYFPGMIFGRDRKKIPRTNQFIPSQRLKVSKFRSDQIKTAAKTKYIARRMVEIRVLLFLFECFRGFLVNFNLPFHP